jgi:hypothetical protein
MPAHARKDRFFVPLQTVMRQLGARSQSAFLSDLRTLSNRERRDVASFVHKEGEA